MVVHAFGAYFGLTVARVLFNGDVHRAEAKESSVYHSDLFAMIGMLNG
jgi:ammonium transporter Rh